MSWFLDRSAEAKPELDGPIPTGIEQFTRSIQQSWLAQDSWQRREHYAKDLQEQMREALGAKPPAVDLADPVGSGAVQIKPGDYGRDTLTKMVAEARQFDPGTFGNLPGSPEEFDLEVKRRYARDQEENDAALARGDSGVAQFAGSMVGAVSDEYSLPLLFLGGSGSLARVAAMEAGLGAAGEVPSVIKQNEVRDWLGQDPLSGMQAAAQIGLGGIAGGVLGTAIAGAGRAIPKVSDAVGNAIPRGVDYLRERMRGEAANRPEDMPGGDYSQDIDAAEQDLRLGGFPDIGKDAPPNWAAIRGGIFAGESGGDYDALFGFSNREGGPFADVKLTEMTVDQALAFSDPNGKYGQWVKGEIGRVATPMGAYQIVGTTLRAAKKGLGLKGDEVMTPKLQERLGQWIYRNQGTGAWEGYRGTDPNFRASEGGTYQGPPAGGDGGAFDPGAGTGRDLGNFPKEVTTPSGTRVPVQWKVVDLSELTAASGDLQPRDRSRAASDAQISEIAARLDPRRMMPTLESDRGAPIIGPDMVVESGNGRIAALRQSMAQNPDAYAAYVAQIKGVADIPEGVKNPVLVGQRTGDMSRAERVAFVRESNMSGIARMAPTEQAKFDAGYLDQRAFDAYVPGARFNAPENAPFARRMLSLIPAEERSAFLGRDGTLNRDGIRRVREALFARAFDADDLLTLFAETESRQVESLIGMLEQVAPDWAYFRAGVEAGLIRPEFDITPQLMDAVRLIAKARVAGRDGKSVIAAIRDTLAQGDMFAEADPLVEAMIDAFYKGERARPASATEEILKRYASEAMRVGRADIADVLDVPVTPRDALRAAVDGYDGKSPFEPMAGRPAPSEPLSGPVEPLQDISAVDPARYADGAQSAAAERADTIAEDALREAVSSSQPLDPETAAAREAWAGREGQSFSLSGDPNGEQVTVTEVLDDLDADTALIERMSFCNMGGGA